MRRAAGFTLIETIFALSIMAGELLSLAAVFSAGLVHLNSGNSLMVAKVKAAEAIESVFMSRDTGVISWDQGRNGRWVRQRSSFVEDGNDPLQVVCDRPTMHKTVLGFF